MMSHTIKIFLLTHYWPIMCGRQDVGGDTQMYLCGYLQCQSWSHGQVRTGLVRSVVSKQPLMLINNNHVNLYVLDIG